MEINWIRSFVELSNLPFYIPLLSSSILNYHFTTLYLIKGSVLKLLFTKKSVKVILMCLNNPKKLGMTNKTTFWLVQTLDYEYKQILSMTIQ